MQFIVFQMVHQNVLQIYCLKKEQQQKHTHTQTQHQNNITFTSVLMKLSIFIHLALLCVLHCSNSPEDTDQMTKRKSNNISKLILEPFCVQQN